MALIDMAKEKWARKTVNAISKWQSKVADTATFNSYVKGIATVTGLSESEVASSMPARNFREFQANVSMYAEKYKSKVTSPLAKEKWAKNYINAFKAH